MKVKVAVRVAMRGRLSGVLQIAVFRVVVHGAPMGPLTFPFGSSTENETLQTCVCVCVCVCTDMCQGLMLGMDGWWG